MTVIRITNDTCPACILLKEIMSRIMDQYPTVEIVDYDERLDAEECADYPHKAVPFLKCGDLTLEGVHKSTEIKEYLDQCLNIYGE